MAPFSDADQVEAVLEGLRTREDGPFVARLARLPGRRDSQYAHLFSGLVADSAPSESEVAQMAPTRVASAVISGAAPMVPATADRIARLENEVRQLREELDSLKKQLGV